MATRTLPALRLKKSPLVQVLAQVRFSTVLKMENFLPSIQERLRASYPGFKVATSEEILLRPEDASIASRRNTRWLLLDQEEREAVVLSPDFFVLLTSSYSAFEKFGSRFAEVLNVVHEEANIGVSERVGIRYVDRIVPRAGEEIAQYVKPGLAGLPSSVLSSPPLQVEPTFNQHEVRTRTAVDGQLAIRTFERDGRDLRMPPGLEEPDIELGITESAQNTLLLDIDHFTLARRPFDPEALVDTAWALHDYSDLAFRQSTTEHAMTVWEAEA